MTGNPIAWSPIPLEDLASVGGSYPPALPPFALMVLILFLLAAIVALTAWDAHGGGER